MSRALVHALLTCRPAPLALAVLAYLAGVVAIAERLRIAAITLGLRLPRTTAARIGLSAVLASHLSFGAAAAEATRLVWLRRFLGDARESGRTLFAILAVDRVADGAAIATMVLAGLLRARTDARPLVLGLAPLAIAAVVLLVVSKLSPVVAPRRLAIGSGRALPAALSAWAFDLLRLYVVGRAVGLSLDLRACCALAIAAIIGGQVPTPAGLVAVEAALVGAGTWLALPPGALAAFVVVDRILTLGLGTVLGAVASFCLARTPIRRNP